MAERSFVEEVKKLRLGEGELFTGEGILAVTKALLESGVSYVAGYQGAPISHLMDVLADAGDILAEHGIRFDNSASEATAAATLAASVNYPLRGAVTFKGPVGVNVASDALANLASGGVTGGAIVIVGEDYGEGSSIMQERTHAFAMKSQMWLLDPRPDLGAMVRAVKAGFELSEASHTPVMLELRIRACHVHGSFVAGANRRAAYTLHDALAKPDRDLSRIVLPPMSFAHEKEKITRRWPEAVRFIEERGLNEVHAGADPYREVGIVVQGGHVPTLLRALERLGLADVYGRTSLPLYVLNVVYPLCENELVAFCAGKRHLLVVEEGQPNFIEQAIAEILGRHGTSARLHGKDVLPMAGEYTTAVVRDGLRGFLAAAGVAPTALVPATSTVPVIPGLDTTVHGRPPGFCTGCPERPIFSAMKLVERELGPHHVSADIGCHLFSILPPFGIGHTTMGYGLGGAGASAFNPPQPRPGAAEGDAPRRAVAFMGDGGFWHNGLTSGIANAVFNQSELVTVVVDNSYTSATGGQDVLSSRQGNPVRSTNHAIEQAVRGVGVPWVKTITRTYDVEAMRQALRDALTTKERGPKVIIAQSECMLNRQRREKPQVRAALARGERQVRERFGVDADTCTGDHSCIRLSGCPSLSIRPNPDPLRTDPIAAVEDSCVGCGHCGEVSHAAVLCPSFYKASVVSNPSRADRFRQGLRQRVIGWLQGRESRARVAREAAFEAALAAAREATAPVGASALSILPLASATSATSVDRADRATVREPRRFSPQPPAGQPIKLAILAMGGEGGGVLADWVVDLAEHEGWIAQSTSVPGVAQRTGATIYYVELFPGAAAEAAGAKPVLALMPMPGDVDVVVASELMEAGRAVQRGLVTPDRTTLIGSTHRVYSIAEKTAMGDGRVASEALLAAADAASARLVAFDMADAARATGSAISAVMFGALAGSGVLPFPRAAWEMTIERSGIGVKASLAAFARGHAEASPGGPAPRVAQPEAGRRGPSAGMLDSTEPVDPARIAAGERLDAARERAGASASPASRASPISPAATSTPESAAASPAHTHTDPHLRLLALRALALPAAASALALTGTTRCIDFLDTAHADEYLARLERLATISRDPTLLCEAARHLALWMTYEDTIRVAQLKTRATRFERVRHEVRAQDAQIVDIDEYLHPRVQEIAETVPAWLGRRIEAPGALRRLVERMTTQGRIVTTTSIRGHVLLATLAGLRRWRRSTLRHQVEMARIDAWLARVGEAARRDVPFATELVRCQRLVKGYSDTHARGLANFETVMATLAAEPRADAARVRQLREAALADEQGRTLAKAVAEGAPAAGAPTAAASAARSATAQPDVATA